MHSHQVFTPRSSQVHPACLCSASLYETSRSGSASLSSSRQGPEASWDGEAGPARSCFSGCLRRRQGPFFGHPERRSPPTSGQRLVATSAPPLGTSPPILGDVTQL